MSCPNPSAHPVDVRHTRRTPARESRPDATRQRPAGNHRDCRHRHSSPSRPPRPTPTSRMSRPRSTGSTTRRSRPRSATTTPSSTSPTSARTSPPSGPTSSARATSSRPSATRSPTPILRGYQGESISTVGQVVVSDDPGAFLGQLSTMSGFNDLQDNMFDAYSTELEALDLRREATADRAAEIAETTEQLAAEK